jgi:hypothetical protein
MSWPANGAALGLDESGQVPDVDRLVREERYSRVTSYLWALQGHRVLLATRHVDAKERYQRKGFVIGPESLFLDVRHYVDHLLVGNWTREERGHR